MKKVICVIIMLLFIMTGCSSQPEINEGIITENPELLKNDIVNMDNNGEFEAYLPDASNSSVKQGKLPYHKFSHMISRMEIGEDFSLHIIDIEISGKEMYRFFGEQGEISRELEGNYGFLYYYKENDSFYVFNVTSGRIDELNSGLEYKKTVLYDFHPFEIKEMSIKNNSLYVLYVQENPYKNNGEEVLQNENGYADYGETIIKVSLDDCNSVELKVPGLVTMFDSENEYLYLYVYREGSYYIDVFDTSTDKTIYSIGTTEAGYVFTFAVIGKMMYYYSAEASGLCSLDLKTKDNKLLISGYMSLLQSDMDSEGKYLICYDRNRWEIFTLDTETGEISTDEGNKRKINEECDVIIGAINLPFDPTNVSEITELTIGGYESPIYADEDFSQQLMFKLMAGDEDIDIFLFYSSDPSIKKLSTDGVCLNLSVSSRLADENRRYFQNISDYFRTDRGAIWGLPLSSYIPVIISYEDNLRQKGISSEDFKDFRTMLDSLKKLSDLEGVFVYGSDYGNWLLANYITNNKRPDFTSGIFKDYFVNMWNGWKCGEENGLQNHPYLGKAELVKVKENDVEYYLGAAANAWVVDPKKTLFHMVGVNDILTKDYLSVGTSIIPLPLISDGYRQSITIPLIAIVNPNGKHKENAIRFLEDYSEYIRENGMAGLIYKDRKDYPDYYLDIETYNDIYEICKDALVMDHGMGNDYFYNEIKDYQSGEIDIDIALKSMQRKEDAYRNE